MNSAVEVDSSEETIMYSNIFNMSYLLLNLNNIINYEHIKKNMDKELIKYLIYFKDVDLNSDSLTTYLKKRNINMTKIKTILSSIIVNNKERIFIDLEEQYFSIQKQLNKYSNLHDGFRKHNQSLSLFLNHSYQKLETDLKKIKLDLEVPLNIRDKISDNTLLKISNLKKSLDILEKDCLSYRKNLCQYLGIDNNKWTTLFLQYCSHLVPINQEELERQANSIKRYLTKYEKDNNLDYIGKKFQDAIFIKVKKKSYLYSLAYGNSYINNKEDSNFCRKIIQERFTVDFTKKWENYCFSFSQNIVNGFFDKLKNEINLNRIQFHEQFDFFMENNPVFEDTLTKSIKEVYRKNPCNILNFDFKTASLYLDDNFSQQVEHLFLSKMENELMKFKDFINKDKKTLNNVNFIFNIQPQEKPVTRTPKIK